MDQPQIVEFTAERTAAYLQFAAKQFGDGSAAASEQYLNWLYHDNPFGGSFKDALLVALPNGDIVGCVHAMKVPWRLNDTDCVVPAIHNLMIAPDYRQGIGMKLVLKSMQSQCPCVIPAAAGGLAELYKRLGCTAVDSSWYRRVISPLKTAWRMGVKKVTGQEAPPRHFPSTVEASPLPSAHGRGFWATTLNDELCSQLATALNRDRSADGPHFTPQFLRWRFFHEHGPRHAAVWIENEGQISDALLLSLGPRQGFNVGRIVAATRSDQDHFGVLVKLAEHVIRHNGGTLLFAFCASPELKASYSALGWQPMPNGPATFFYNKKGQPISNIAFGGEAVDIGFEAMIRAA